MKIQTENSLSIYHASALPKPSLTEHCGELRREAKDWASPRESEPSEFDSSPLPSKEPHRNAQRRAAKRNDWSKFLESWVKSSQPFFLRLKGPKRNAINKRDLKGGRPIYRTSKVANSIITSADNRCRSHLNSCPCFSRTVILTRETGWNENAVDEVLEMNESQESTAIYWITIRHEVGPNVSAVHRCLIRASENLLCCTSSPQPSD